jgi:Co/Zn/Cd efflux system component
MFVLCSSLFSWARLELLAGLLQEVLLLSLSLSIIIDAINKLINPNHIEDPSAMIYLGAAGCLIGLLGLFLFRGYHHDHNIGDEIVEQKKNDFVQSVYNTLRNRDLDEQKPKSTGVPALVISETSSSLQREKYALILPSLNETYKNAFVAADNATTVRRTEDPFDDHSPSSESQLRVPENASQAPRRMRSHSGDSFLSSTVVLNDGETILEDDFQESRVYATLHALCLHSLVSLSSIH